MENNKGSLSENILNNAENIYDCGISIQSCSVEKSKINLISFLQSHLNLLFLPYADYAFLIELHQILFETYNS